MSVLADYPTPDELWEMWADPLDIALHAYAVESREVASYHRLARPPAITLRGTLLAALRAVANAEEKTCDAWQRVFDEYQQAAPQHTDTYTQSKAS